MITADAHLEFGTAPFKGLCLNIGEIESDGAYNVIPTIAKLWLLSAPPPGVDVAESMNGRFTVFLKRR